jgi:hypothetical protein
MAATLGPAFSLPIWIQFLAQGHATHRVLRQVVAQFQSPMFQEPGEFMPERAKKSGASGGIRTLGDPSGPTGTLTTTLTTCAGIRAWNPSGSVSARAMSMEWAAKIAAMIEAASCKW